MYRFLSDPWLAAVAALREDIDGLEDPPGVEQLRINFRVVAGPEGDELLHIAGSSALCRGLLDDVTAEITIGYETARALFVSADAAAALEAFMVGELEIEGDVTGLMAMQHAIFNLTPGQAAFHEVVNAITADNAASSRR